MEKSIFERQKINFTTLLCRHSSDSDSGGDYGVSEDENENLVIGNPVVVVIAPVVLAQQALPPGPPADPLLVPNGHQWRVDGEVSVDVGLLNRRTRLIWPGNANLLGDPLPVREELDYFRLLYPMQLNQSTIQQTNAVLVRAGRAVMNESELLKYYGIRLNMTLDRKRLDIREYWEETEREGSTFPPPDYGKFNMTRHRFQYISSALRFSNYDEGLVNEVRTLFRIYHKL